MKTWGGCEGEIFTRAHGHLRAVSVSVYIGFEGSVTDAPLFR
jgi:hypothetical protein